MRLLTLTEIEQLKQQNNHAQSWQAITVHQDFTAQNIYNNYFEGTVTLGICHSESAVAGIYNCTLRNCTIGNYCYLKSISGVLENYQLGNHVTINGAHTIACTQPTSCGVASVVQVLNETGGIEVPLLPQLSAQLAYWFIYGTDKLKEYLWSLAKQLQENAKTTQCFIADGVRITECMHITNTNIGPHAQLTGVTKLNACTLCSTPEAPVVVTHNVIAEHVLLQEGAQLLDGAIASYCLVGQGSCLAKQFSAQNCLFFSNCDCANGEALATVAGPYTVSHHKSTGLAGALVSFFNAGGGSQQSNHLYKLGPIHHGALQRGSKTASDANILWPAVFGAFSLIMGKHSNHPNTQHYPFSYCCQHNSSKHTVVVPGVNLYTIGTYRDTLKWPQRDKRQAQHKYDLLNFNVLTPLSVQNMLAGIEELKQLLATHADKNEFITDAHLLIYRKDALRGLEVYDKAINQFIGESLVYAIQNRSLSVKAEDAQPMRPNKQLPPFVWNDYLGLIAPVNLMYMLEDDVVGYRLDYDAILKKLNTMHGKYHSYAWYYCLWLIEMRYQTPLRYFSTQNWQQLADDYFESLQYAINALEKDLSKELTLLTTFNASSPHQCQNLVQQLQQQLAVHTQVLHTHIKYFV